VLTVAVASMVVAPAPASAESGNDSARPYTDFATRTTLAATGTGLPAAAVAGARAGGGDPQAYAFIDKVDRQPVHWNKCRRIGYRISLRRAPDGAVRQTKEAVSRVAAASGLRFAYEGTSRVRPRINADYQRGTRLVIGWMTPRESPVLSGSVAGIGGPLYYTSGSHRGEIVKGFAQLDAGLNTKLADGFGTGPRRGYQGTKGQLLMHEIAHAVGLDHVRDTRQILYYSLTRKRAVFGAGDRNGLEQVGRRRSCF
jgi:hypothetical protein